MSNESNKNNSQFLKQAGILTAAGILCRIIGILYRSPLTGIIGDTGNGIYSYAYYIYSIILLVSSYSIPSAISKEISIKIAMKEYRNAQRIFNCAIIYVIAVGGFTSLLTYFGADLLIKNGSAMALKIFSPAIFFSGLLGVLRGYFQAHKTMLQTSISQILEQLINALVSILAAYIFIQMVSNQNAEIQAIYGAAGSALGTGMGVMTALLFMLIVYFLNRDIIKRHLNHDTISTIDPYKKIFKRITLTVTPIILSTFIYNFNTSLNTTVFSQILIVGKGYDTFYTQALYGIFSGKSVVIANIPVAIASAMSAALLPNISGIYLKGNTALTNEKIDTAIRTTMLIAIPSAIGILVMARPIVQFLFPEPHNAVTALIPYTESLALAVSLLRSLSVTVIFYSLSTLTNAVLQGTGKINLPVINASVALVAQTIVFVVILLFTEWNLYAFVIAAILYSFLMCILNGISVSKHLGYRINWKKNFLIPFAAAVIMGVAAGLSYRLFFGVIHSNVISLFVSILIAVVLYFSCVLKFGGINDEELKGFPKGPMLLNLAKKLRLL